MLFYGEGRYRFFRSFKYKALGLQGLVSPRSGCLCHGDLRDHPGPSGEGGLHPTL